MTPTMWNVRRSGAVLTLLLLFASLIAARPAEADLVLAPEIEGNDTPATATPLEDFAGVAQGDILPSGDVDYYSFSAAAGDRVYVATMIDFSAVRTDTLLQLIASDGTTVLEFDEGDGWLGPPSSSIAGAPLPATGTYFLRVSPRSPGYVLFPYRLFWAVRSGAPAAETEPNDTPGQRRLPASGWVAGATSSAADLDYYSLDLAAGDTVFVSLDLDPERDAVEWQGRVAIGPLGSQGSYLGGSGTSPLSFTPAPPNSAAYFLTVKEAGTYLVLVAAGVGGTTFGTYHLSVVRFPGVPATGSCTTYASTDVPKRLHYVTPIVGVQTEITSTITVPGHPRIADLDVAITIDHERMADLDAHLKSPAGNDNGLFGDVGSRSSAGGGEAMDLVFDDEAAIPPTIVGLDGTHRTPEAMYRLDWFDGEDAGGTWTLVLHDDEVANSGWLTSWSITICEPEPACPAGTVPVTIYAEDFEGGDGGFTHAGTGDEWEWGTPSYSTLVGCASGTGCWATDLDSWYDTNSSQDLLSPPIDLAGSLGPVVVSWAMRYQLESARYDHFFVDIQEAGGADPRPLFDWRGPTMQTDIDFYAGIGGSAGWGTHERRADAYAGRSVELRFHLDSGSSWNNYAGVGIDDVAVTLCQASCNGLQATIFGAEGDDVITGTEGPDVIAGLGGNDTISGLGGDDVICGGDGDDVISGGAGNDRIYGDAGNDRLAGNGGRDRLFGGEGRDRLSGGPGRDRCSGGQGRDRARTCERSISVP